MIGRSFRIGRQPFEIVGVAPKGFTGTEPGRMADLFVPAMMNAQALNRAGLVVVPDLGASHERRRRPSAFGSWSRRKSAATARTRSSTSRPTTPGPDNHRLLERADPLLACGGRRIRSAAAHSVVRCSSSPALVVLVLLIACANVANLLPAQACHRAREMALRVSIGAGRWRLIQLVLVEGALLAICASVVGAVFAWWAAPFVVSLLAHSENRFDWCSISTGASSLQPGVDAHRHRAVRYRSRAAGVVRRSRSAPSRATTTRTPTGVSCAR